jgi:alkanesulfonate monooxygenase SsuD/methylene tetrahydromethanopterin reductase-like flavin-dependent oxidoreductase (luciferase family)
MTRFGLVLSRFDPAVALAAEEHGFTSLWLRDGPLHGCTLLGALAAVTSTVRLGAIVDVTHRNPAIVAKQVTTLDLVSHGRAVLALRAVDSARLHEAVRVARAMFRDDRVTVEGRHWSTKDAVNRPAAAQPGGPPIVVMGDAAVAARQADGVGLVGDRAEVQRQLTLVARHCGESGRDRASLSTLWLASGSDRPEAVAEAARAAGIDDLVLDLGDAGPDAVLATGRAVHGVTGAAR